MSDEKEYKPFEAKPAHLKSGYIRRKDKWENNQQEASDKDIEHRRFNCTLTVNQMVTGFKRCVHSGEVAKEPLITCYRVVLQKLLQDPNLTDTEFLSMYSQISTRANEIYSKRSRRLRKIKV